MRLRSLLFALALWCCACASSSTSTSETGAQTARRSSDVITSVELTNSTAKEAFEAIDLLRPQWFRKRGGASFAVYVNNIRMDIIESLRSIPVAQIEEIRYLNASAATTFFGTGHMGGAIVVKTKS